jgi:hypothetical protein
MSSAAHRGSASIEFVVVAVTIFLPILALTVSASTIQTAQFAVAAIARQGVRVYALSATPTSGAQRIVALDRLVREDFGMSASSTWSMRCSLNPCLSRGGLIRLTVSADIPIAMIPVLPGIVLPPSVRVESTATHAVPMGAVR